LSLYALVAEVLQLQRSSLSLYALVAEVIGAITCRALTVSLRSAARLGLGTVTPMPLGYVLEYIQGKQDGTVTRQAVVTVRP